MRIVALDIGDVHTGIAISDPMGIIARPLKTVHTPDLHTEINRLVTEDGVLFFVVGHPTTLRGTKSEQTLKVEAAKKELEEKFPTAKWVFWDERLTSKSAASIKKITTKEQKLQSHAIAASIILTSYLAFTANKIV